VERGEDGVRVAVRDEGPGIPHRYHGRVFEKFGQVEAREAHHKHTTGLGLTFCKLAVEAHGGTIGVDSDGEQGSTFWFTLPAGGPTAPGGEGSEIP
jgi:two-component system, sensor histidine kinase and response regulator